MESRRKLKMQDMSSREENYIASYHLVHQMRYNRGLCNNIKKKKTDFFERNAKYNRCLSQFINRLTFYSHMRHN